MSEQVPTAAQWKELRKAFPKEAVGKIPKGGVQLDYVGHAAVTDRLLEVDPQWTWEPLAYDGRGLPALDEVKNLWIKLTVLGVTRIGVGDGPSMKERIGDALRNAAMRFGVALDLWTKEELESTLADPSLKNDKSTIGPAETSGINAKPPVQPVSPAQKAQITALLRGAHVKDENFAAVVTASYGYDIKALTKTTAADLIERIKSEPPEVES